MTHGYKRPTAAEHAARLTHENAIHVRLTGGMVEEKNLRMAVAYFHKGAGATLEKPCCEHAWASLLRETGYAPTATPSSFCGNFRHC